MPEVYASAMFDAVMSSLADRHVVDNVEEDSTIPPYYFGSRYSQAPTYQPTPISPRDFYGAKAPLREATNKALVQRPVSSVDSDNDFDSLYDVTDDEFEVPLHASASVKKTARNRYPSIVIPSPSAWPTIEKLKSAMSAMPQTPAQLPTPSLQGLSLIASHNLRVPSHSVAPSLDGSLTSEEMDRLSCPATPDSHRCESPLGRIDNWAPVQLDMQALQTLRHLNHSVESSRCSSPAPRDYSIATQAGEMREIVRPSLGLDIPSYLAQVDSAGTTPVSSLSVPSPGGFFSQLQDTARHTWSVAADDNVCPNTSTAENFYGVPWMSQHDSITEQTVTLAGSTLDGWEDDLPTARPTFIQNPDEVKEINPSKTIFQYNENYQFEIMQTGAEHLERTDTWLEDQQELQAALRDMEITNSPTLSSGTHSRDNSITKVKKSVTFAAEEPVVEEKETKELVTYVQGFDYLRNRSCKSDVYIHRQTRAEAMHVRRRCDSKAHRDQLMGKYELTNPVRPAPPRPVSEFYTNDPTVLKERIARAQTERQALDQLLPISWVLQAQKQLNGGSLLSKPAKSRLRRSSAARVLDLGGVATNDWAWAVARDFPTATITTVYTAGNNHTSNVTGPHNHKTMTVPNMWTLPFPSNHFDVISARTIHELLKTDKPMGRSVDEYDLCLKECHRCLKTGGIIEYSLLDADMIHAGPQAQAMGVEFGFNLKTRGYDAAPTKSFIARVHKAGFSDVNRMWMVLPAGKTAANWKESLPVGADVQQEEKTIGPEGQVEVVDAPIFGSTANAAMMTGMVGSWAWEKWMLRLQLEMGKDEEKLLEGVVQVLEESAKEGAGWRMLTGYATK